MLWLRSSFLPSFLPLYQIDTVKHASFPVELFLSNSVSFMVQDDDDYGIRVFRKSSTLVWFVVSLPPSLCRCDLCFMSFLHAMSEDKVVLCNFYTMPEVSHVFVQALLIKSSLLLVEKKSSDSKLPYAGIWSTASMTDSNYIKAFFSPEVLPDL